MNKLKNLAYGATATAIALAPAVASAQLGVTMTNGGLSGLSSSSVTNLATQAMYWLLGLVGFLGIIGFVISGILYLTAAGDETQIEKAKTAMIYSIVGIIVALIGYVVMTAVKSFLSGGSSTF